MKQVAREGAKAFARVHHGLVTAGEPQEHLIPSGELQNGTAAGRVGVQHVESDSSRHHLERERQSTLLKQVTLSAI